ncbi:uncharacterized protein EV420DRAFT_1569217 [Desarmillaria tabescens]|uniref:F-box domain-containing protein n=1 Tax=Armillaria tabescens TaxID=1929756 RepID=A0AA39JQK3_ARMTA|nr:uncharacterized protein EV420DRAFT_1569217 [Desarmillaria tabescens]KAK0446978.1 hypothetical protein EV420DRAFT_1569217 [Desarmillaria tabescens]
MPTATTISSLPTEILEILLLWEYPKCDTHYLKRELLRLSTVCRRFREILARHIYRQFSSSLDTRHPQALIETFSFRGHFITTLTISLQAIHRTGPSRPSQRLSTLLALFRSSTKHLTSLQSLYLNIRPDFGVYAHSSSSFFPYPPPPSDSRLFTAELEELKSLFKSLPPQLEELILAGFSWLDAAQEARSRPPLATSNFLRGCPKVKDIELPASWCPEAEWFRRAFDGRQFEHLRIGFKYWGYRNSATHSCTSKKCEWSESIIAVFSNSSQSLKSVTIGTPSFPYALLKAVMPGVTSLSLLSLGFDDDSSTLNAFMRPFLKSPLERLTIMDCMETPESLTEYIDPRPHIQAWRGQSGFYWPALKYFKADFELDQLSKTTR